MSNDKSTGIGFLQKYLTLWVYGSYGTAPRELRTGGPINRHPKKDMAHLGVKDQDKLASLTLDSRQTIMSKCKYMVH